MGELIYKWCCARFYWICTSSVTPVKKTSPDTGQRFDLCTALNGVGK